MAVNMGFKLPKWMALWLFFSSIFVLLDAFFVLLRPRTLPGGDLSFIVSYYSIYIEIDKRYKDMNDGFNIGQSWMNLVEVFLNIVTLILHKKVSVYTVLVALIATTMTWAKTVLYFLMSSKLCHGHHFIADLPWFKFVFMFLIPNGIWIVFPLFCMVSLVLQIAHLMQTKEKKQ